MYVHTHIRIVHDPLNAILPCLLGVWYIRPGRISIINSRTQWEAQGLGVQALRSSVLRAVLQSKLWAPSMGPESGIAIFPLCI